MKVEKYINIKVLRIIDINDKKKEYCGNCSDLIDGRFCNYYSTGLNFIEEGQSTFYIRSSSCISDMD